MRIKDTDHRAVLSHALTTIDELERRLAEAETAEPIAVVGIGCRLPGGVTGPSSFWKLLDEGRDGTTEVPAERWDADRYRSDDPSAPGSIRSGRGGFLQGWRPDQFDADFFGLSPREAMTIDPQHRLILEVAWEAVENAGYAPGRLSRTRTGVYVGITSYDYVLEQFQNREIEDVDAYTLFGGVPNHAAGRISYSLGLHGPSMAVDTACSSSLASVHLACEDLRGGRADAALAGGVNLMLRPETSVSMSRFGALSPDGVCRTFDAAADGYARGEGCGVVVLKRLSDARHDGDRVLGLIRGGAVNQDGPSSGITVPFGPAQQDVIRQALDRANLEPSDIDYVEAHGTATPLGDPIELGALHAVYQRGRSAGHRTVVGSVKTNIGHTEGAAGVASLIKTLLSMRHRRIPRHLHFDRLTPKAGPEARELLIPAEPMDWPDTGAPPRAAISSFGVSGTNAHLVVEAAPEDTGTTRSAPEARERTVLLPLSARTEEALVERARSLADWIESEDPEPEPSALAATLGRGRAHHKARAVLPVERGDSLAEVLRAYTPSPEERPACPEDSGVVFVFSGQGSQWSGMGRGLLDEPAFAETVTELEPVFAAEAGFSLREALVHGDVTEGIERVQPVLFAMQVALARTWVARGLTPAAVIGHSMGEIAAAVVAGALTPDDGARVVCRRSRLMGKVAGNGMMALVELSAGETKARLKGVTGVEVAVLSSPRSTVVSGSTEAVEELKRTWEADGVPVRPIRVDVASHSAQVDPLLDDLEAELRDVASAEPHTPLYSTVTDDPLDLPAFDARYWVDNLRRPVRFAPAVRAVVDDGPRLFVEVSPHPSLTYALTEVLEDQGVTDGYVSPTLRRDEPEREQLRTNLARLYERGADVDWAAAGGERALLDPPPYPWQWGSYWNAPPKLKAPAEDEHVLLGRHTAVPGTPARHLWSVDLDVERVPWLVDHQLNGMVVLPGTAYCEMALSAARQVFGVDAAEIAVHGVEYRNLLVVNGTVPVVTTLTEEGPGRGEVLVRTRDGEGDWIVHAVAKVGPAERQAQPLADPELITRLRERHPRKREADELYRTLRSAGQFHGPAFARISGLFTDGRDGDAVSVLGEVGPAVPERRAAVPPTVSPALLDACFQVLGAALTGVGDDAVLVPEGLDRLTVSGDPSTGVLSHTVLRNASGAQPVGDVTLYAADGHAVLAATGIRLSWARGSATHGAADPSRLFEVVWEHAEPHPAPTDPEALNGLWIVVSDNGSGTALADELRSRGAACQLVDRSAPDTELLSRIGSGAAVRAVVMAFGPPVDVLDPAAALDTARDRVWDVVRVARAAATGDGPLPSVWLVTRGAQAVTRDESVDLAQGAIRGVFRTLLYEYSALRPRLVDLEPGTDSYDALVAELAADTREDEVALRSAGRYVARMENTPNGDTGTGPVESRAARYGQDSFGLECGQPGILDSLRLVERDRPAPGPGEVEISVRYAGLNFSDVLMAMGLVRPGNGEWDIAFGGEGSGIVTRVGEGVTRFSVGDHVAMIAFGTMGTFVTTREDLVNEVPPGFTLAEAATLLSVYGTAWYGLRNVARVGAGDQVLIHSASGGVGLAAIAVARQLGASIIATAGTEAKRDHLRGLGIEHVFDSRDLSWADEVMRVTDGRGVDVVLNSLSGPALRLGLRVLAPSGRFVEIGKRDIYAGADMDMSPFALGLSFTHVDFDRMVRTQPELTRPLFDELAAEFERGGLAPIPHTEVPLAEASTAFVRMARAEHIGKLVIGIPESGRATVAVTEPRPLVADRGTYLVSGGMTGLGLLVTRWLSDSGATGIVVNGRRAPSPEARTAIEEMRRAGTRVEVVLGDIAEPGTAERMVEAGEALGAPVKGVLHLAVALDDCLLEDLTPDRLDTVWRAKVQGSWYLHEATERLDLDWWVGFSSAVSLTGRAGQGNYAAASAWLDSFASWRRARGLPALVINWGPWARTGLAVDLGDRGYRLIEPEEGIAALTLMLDQQRLRTAYVDFDPDLWFSSYPDTATSPFFSRLVDGGVETAPAPSSDGVRERLEAQSPGPRRRAVMETVVADAVRTVLRLPGAAVLDHSTPFASLGFDSLMGLETRVRLEADTGLRIPSTVVWAHPSIDQLATHLAEEMGVTLDAQDERSTDEALDDGLLDAIFTALDEPEATPKPGSKGTDSNE